jgi:hypothetical protein
LGAKAVLIARPYLWGLAANGEEGVTRVLDMLRDEIDCAMAQLGRPNIKSIDSTDDLAHDRQLDRREQILCRVVLIAILPEKDLLTALGNHAKGWRGDAMHWLRR